MRPASVLYIGIDATQRLWNAILIGGVVFCVGPLLISLKFIVPD